MKKCGERAKAEAMLEKVVNEYGNEFFASLVENEVKLGRITEEESEKLKRDHANLSETEIEANAAKQQKLTPSEVGDPYDGYDAKTQRAMIVADLLEMGAITTDDLTEEDRELLDETGLAKAATTGSGPRHKPTHNANTKTRGKKNMVKKHTKPRKSPGPAPEVLKIEGNWKDAMRTLISKKRPVGGWPKPEKTKAK